MNNTYVLIGAGRMGGALLRGWMNNLGPDDHFIVVDPHADDAVSDTCNRSNDGASCSIFRKVSDIPDDIQVVAWILATKPQLIDTVLEVTASRINENSLIISVAAGVTIEKIVASNIEASSVVRVMPNIGALLGCSVSAAFASTAVSQAQQAITERLFNAVGTFVWLDQEDDLHIATAVSGSGPAYFFAICEAMISAAEKEGLHPDIARLLVLGTVSTSGQLLKDNPDPASLRESVTSPNGTTAAGLSALNRNDCLSKLMSETISAAKERSRFLS